MVARQGRVPGLHPQRRLRQDRGEDQRHLRRSPRLLPANPGGHAFNNFFASSWMVRTKC